MTPALTQLTPLTSTSTRNKSSREVDRARSVPKNEAPDARQPRGRGPTCGWASADPSDDLDSPVRRITGTHLQSRGERIRTP
jgi:hypothetical protein